MEKELWSVEGGKMNMIEIKARIINFEGDYILEIVSRDDRGFWDRVKTMFKYIFYNSKIIYSVIPISREGIKKLKGIDIDG